VDLLGIALGLAHRFTRGLMIPARISTTR
jgi:hypothetical protein